LSSLIRAGTGFGNLRRFITAGRDQRDAAERGSAPLPFDPACLVPDLAAFSARF
jgi:hypothetical protein